MSSINCIAQFEFPYTRVSGRDYTKSCRYFILCDPLGKTTSDVISYDCERYDSISYRTYCYGDTLFYNSNVISIDECDECFIHKIYLFVNDTCIKYVCNYLVPIGNKSYRIDKQEIATMSPLYWKGKDSSVSLK